MTSVSVGDVTFTNNPRAMRSDGSLWLFDTLDGWHDGPPVKGSTTDRPAAHGVFGERVWRGARMVSVRGSVLCVSRAQASRVQMTLAALLAEGHLADLTVSDVDQGDLTATVRLATDPSINWDRVSTVVDYDLRFLAPDPLRYGAPVSVSTSFPELVGGLEYDLYTDGAGADLGYLDYGAASTTGRVALSNPGTADSWPQFEVTGPVSSAGFEIATVGTDARLVFAGGVPAGSRLVLDSATGAVLIDGQADRAGLLTFRDWAPIPAGGSVEYAFIPRGPSSDASLSVSVRPAFW